MEVTLPCGWVGWPESDNMAISVGGWLDQVGIRLTQLSTGLKVEAELGNFCKLK